jgi:hypothetical protein
MSEINIFFQSFHRKIQLIVFLTSFTMEGVVLGRRYPLKVSQPDVSGNKLSTLQYQFLPDSVKSSEDAKVLLPIGIASSSSSLSDQGIPHALTGGTEVIMQMSKASGEKVTLKGMTPTSTLSTSTTSTSSSSHTSSVQGQDAILHFDGDQFVLCNVSIAVQGLRHDRD